MSVVDVLIGQPKENWAVIETDGEVHVAPIKGKPHETGTNWRACWCLPRHEQHERTLVVHNEAN